MTDIDAHARNRDSWSRYWAAQPAHSLPGSFDDGYAGSIAAFWKDVSAELPPQAAVLDLATGNGPVPRLLMRLRPDLQIDAVDAADVAPQWASDGRSMPRFHPRVRCEALPFPEATFDLISSQYGIEYAELSSSLAEVARVLRDGGTFAAVVHSRDSRIVTVAAEELAHANALLLPGAALDAITALVPFMALAGKQDTQRALNANPCAGVARDRFNQSMDLVRFAASRSSTPDLLRELLQWAPQLLAFTRTTGQVDAALQACDRYREQLEDAVERYRALLVAARSLGEMQQLVEDLRAVGIQQSGIANLLHDGHTLGWSLRACRQHR
ncbi:class I SAM-dependent methyltransferase [Stenotrophomonas sp. YIM B06876]|uniref:class I SAM-dependent methyltransferase n=1 Tax=Stenotrophomonas sp. YIM B06876 TaxID=3060211 RepID=UPI002739D2CD|nr:class I SAM-dependent methyltransferase [Stenotrophomonas sp. YIM B06876]